MMLAAWIAFGGSRGLDFDLSVGVVLFIVAAALPWLIRTTASHHIQAKGTEVRPFLYSEVDTATGPLTGREVWLQIILVPASLALAATLIGAVYAFDR
jgi:ribose/xylose/arabinose/galactoside ABC-type transport system permease subunit